MAVPKKKTSHAHKMIRRSQNSKISARSLAVCKNCGELMMPHKVCKKCGYYDGKQIVTIEK
ncbi:MAG: 50S ribosomal protein L32 [Clostridia bacterium]|nr:50S ribosomal protein L32 [Clostridia bacterium]